MLPDEAERGVEIAGGWGRRCALLWVVAIGMFGFAGFSLEEAALRRAR